MFRRRYPEAGKWSGNCGNNFYFWLKFQILKNLSLVLNIVLLAAVVFLYIKVYSGNEEVQPTPTLNSNAAMPVNAIVYVNTDSLLSNYNYFNELRERMEQKQDSIDNFLQSRASALERDMVSYQKQAMEMTENQRMKEEERLMKRQQDLIDLKENLFEDLREEKSRMNDSVHHHLTQFLREFNKARNYYFILGYQRGSGILLAEDSLDITKEVLSGLNQ